MKKAEKNNRQSFDQIFSDIVEHSKRGRREDLEYLLSIYLGNSNSKSKMAKNALVKTRGNIRKVLLEYIDDCRNVDINRWMKLAALGIRINPMVFLEDYLDAYEGNYDDKSFIKNIGNIDWNDERVLRAAIEVMKKRGKIPKFVALKLFNESVQNEAIIVAKEQVIKGHISLAYLELISQDIEEINDPEIQNILLSKIAEYSMYDEINKLYKFINFNTKSGKALLKNEHDLSRLYGNLYRNVFGIEETSEDYGNSDVILVWKCIQGLSLTNEELEQIEKYVVSLKDDVDAGKRTVSIKAVLSFINSLEDQVSHKMLKSLYESKAFKNEKVEECLAIHHDKDIYKKWLSSVPKIKDMSLAHKFSKKLLFAYPEFCSEILDTIKATGNEVLYKNIGKMAEGITPDVNIDTKKEVNEEEDIFTVDFLSDAEMSFLRNLCE